MSFDILQMLSLLTKPKVIIGLLVLVVLQPSLALADSGQSTAQVSVSITVAGHKEPAQPFAGRTIPGDGWVGGAVFSSNAFPAANVKSVTITSVSSGEGTIAPDRLWLRSNEIGSEFIPLDDYSRRSIANPNAASGAPLPDIEFRPTWEDAPGKYQARLKIEPGSGGLSTTDPGFCDFEAEVPPFLNFEVENSQVRFVLSNTGDKMEGVQPIHVRITTNTDLWKVKLSCEQEDVVFELVDPSRGMSSPVSGFSTRNATVTGRQAVNNYLLAFRPVCPVETLKQGAIQVVVECRTER